MMALLNEKGFARMGQLAQGVSQWGDRYFGGWVEKMTPPERQDTSDWAGDADWAQLQQEPLRARWLLRLSGWLILVLLIWAALAQVDEVTRGEGKVVPTSQVQVLQSVDGGVSKTSWSGRGKWWSPARP